MSISRILRTTSIGSLAMLLACYVAFIQSIPNMSDVEPPMDAAELQEFKSDLQIISDENYPLVTEFAKPWDFEN